MPMYKWKYQNDVTYIKVHFCSIFCILKLGLYLCTHNQRSDHNEWLVIRNGRVKSVLNLLPSDWSKTICAISRFYLCPLLIWHDNVVSNFCVLRWPSLAAARMTAENLPNWPSRLLKIDTTCIIWIQVNRSTARRSICMPNYANIYRNLGIFVHL